MPCKAESTDRYEVGVITEVVCTQQCSIPPGAKGMHEIRIRNFGNIGTTVRVDVVCAGEGPLGYASGIMRWGTDVGMDGVQKISRYEEVILREEMAHVKSHIHAPGGIQQVTVDASFCVGQFDAEDLGSMSLTLSVLPVA